jgi:glucose dehydrogenase
MHHPLLRGRRVSIAAAAGLVLVAGALAGGVAYGADGSAPPEIAPNATGWPEHNYDLSNSRATTQTDINSSTVATLKRKWAFKLPYVGQFGAFTSNPIVLNGIVYIQDPDSNVYALKESTGRTSTARRRPPVGRTGSRSATAFCSERPRGRSSRSTRRPGSKCGSTR